jgi:hypothetical protein
MDLTAISEAVGLATSAVGLTGKAAATAAAIKGLIDGDKAANTDETAQLLNTLAAELTSANMMNVQLSEALRNLSQELLRQDSFEKEKARYEMFETGQRDIVFKLRDSAADGQPSHFICPVCLNTESLISFITGEDDYKRCQKDRDHIFQFNNTPFQSTYEDYDPLA